MPSDLESEWHINGLFVGHVFQQSESQEGCEEEGSESNQQCVCYVRSESDSGV